MKHFLLFIIFIIAVPVIKAQNLDRVLVKGNIVVVNTSDIEGVTVYNTSSNVGTVTDENGYFEIQVRLLDEIEFHALQFETIKIKIDEDVIKSQQLTVFLVEHVNRLNEVVIFPYGLSGVLHEDLEKIKTFSPDLSSINMAFGDITAYEFSDDYHSKVDNTIMRQGEFYNGTDLVKITNWLIKPLFGTKESRQAKAIKDTDKSLGVRGVYSQTFIADNFDIPGNRVDEFINYIDAKGVDPELYESGKELDLLEYLSEQSKIFLNQ